MELIIILRGLWQRRLLVALCAVVAIAIGYVLAYQPSFPPQSRSYTVGEATVRILVDTPQSQVTNVAPVGSDTLGSRASVLANLMVDGEVKAAIARQAGLRPNKLYATTQAAGGVDAVLPPSVPATKAYVLTTDVLMNTDQVELPIIKVQAQAPDPEKARKLANAAVKGLSDYLDSKAAFEAVSSGRRLRVTGLGAAEATAASRGPRRSTALALAIFIFLAGCAAITGASAMARNWRQAAAAESAARDTEAHVLDAFGENDLFVTSNLDDEPFDPAEDRADSKSRDEQGRRRAGRLRAKA